MTAVISVCIFKKIIILVIFCVAILILKMEEDTQHFWHIILCYFKKGKNTTEMQKKKICAVYGEGAVTDKTCQKWFVMILAGRCSTVG